MLQRSVGATSSIYKGITSSQVIQETKERLTEGLSGFLRKILSRDDDLQACLGQITDGWPSSLPEAVFATEARAKAWVALNLLLNLPKYIKVDGEVFPLSSNKELLRSLAEPHMPELGLMLFWRKPEQGPKVLNFLAENPFGLRVLPQGLVHWVAFLLTQNPESLQQAVLSGSEEIELPINSIFMLTSESSTKRVTYAYHPDAVTVAVKINLAQPLVFIGHFSRGKDERNTKKAEEEFGADPSASKNPKLKDLYLAVHSACCCFVVPARREGKEVSIQIYSANGQNLARKFEQRLQAANFCRVEAFSFNPVNGAGILEVVNQQSDLLVVVKDSDSLHKDTRRGRKPKFPSNF